MSMAVVMGYIVLMHKRMVIADGLLIRADAPGFVDMLIAQRYHLSVYILRQPGFYCKPPGGIFQKLTHERFVKGSVKSEEWKAESELVVLPVLSFYTYRLTIGDDKPRHIGYLLKL